MKFKQVNTEIVKMNVGDVFIGKYTGQSTRPWTDEDGVEKEITQFHFLGVDENGKENQDDKKVLFADAGLQNKFNTENILNGMIVKIDKMEKVDLGKGGRKVNSYSIAIAE